MKTDWWSGNSAQRIGAVTSLPLGAVIYCDHCDASGTVMTTKGMPPLPDGWTCREPGLTTFWFCSVSCEKFFLANYAEQNKALHQQILAEQAAERNKHETQSDVLAQAIPGEVRV